MNRILVLEDGSRFVGKAFGANKTVIGEIVFTTGMSGYQEAITDLSYQGQLLTFTYPLIGNVGVNREDHESITPGCLAVICKEHARKGNNWRYQLSLDEFLQQKGIVGLCGIDTRRLVRILREHGTMKALLIDEALEQEGDLQMLQEYQMDVQQIKAVSTTKAYPNPNTGRKVVVIDFGLKHSILRELSKRQCDITVVPHSVSSQEIIALDPDGVMLTNGPGDPEVMGEVIAMLREIGGELPIFGICMGHQLLAMAYGCTTYKMKFGHRGFNHPVREIATGRTVFTSQNHGYAVAEESVDTSQLMITHKEINDHTIEGLRHRYQPSFSVQFHPDAAPGPHDAVDLFDEFMEMMDQWKEKHQWQSEQI